MARERHKAMEASQTMARLMGRIPNLEVAGRPMVQLIWTQLPPQMVQQRSEVGMPVRHAADHLASGYKHHLCRLGSAPAAGLAGQSPETVSGMLAFICTHQQRRTSIDMCRGCHNSLPHWQWHIGIHVRDVGEYAPASYVAQMSVRCNESNHKLNRLNENRRCVGLALRLFQSGREA